METRLAENTISQILEILQSSIPALCAVYLFGSQSRGESTAVSDIDIAFLADRITDVQNTWQIAQEIGGKVGKDIDLVDLRESSTVFRMQVISKGCRILVEDYMGIEVFEDNVYSDYARLNEERKYILSDIQEQGSVYAR